MTVDGVVEGGLDEPEELEPEQGTLDLASPDRYERSDWEAATAAVLRKSRRMSDDDADSLVWDKLTRTTLDDIDVLPLGTPSLLDDVLTNGRPTRAGDWDIRAHLSGKDAKALNETALVDLNGGVSSLWLEVTPETDFATLLDEVLLDLAPVVLDSPAHPLAAAEAFLSYVGDRELAEGTNLGADPIGALSRRRGFETGASAPSSTNGGSSAPSSTNGGSSAPSSTNDVVAVAVLARRAGVLGVVVDATAVHDLGASDAQELGYSMAVGATYLRELTDSGLAVDEAAGLIEFRYAATDEQFPTIAKLRAARRLWARVLELSEATSVEQRQHVVTSRPMMSKYDPWVNMLRTTVAAFAAGTGGADAVTVLSFDSPLGGPDVLGRRIARNTSALLMFESHVAKVADPAGGSFAVEKLTDDLAQAGWAELDRIEQSGGILSAVGDGSVHARIGETVARREAEVATRARPITGLTEFPNLAETLPERAPDSAHVEVRRYGASFEALRDEPAAHPVFLATLGPVAGHTARATFATNLLAAGGIAVDVAGATAGVDDLVAAYDGQQLVCLAGADPAYAEWGAEAVAALRDAGATWVIVAGKPRDDTDDSCATGVDALDFLTRTREKLS